MDLEEVKYTEDGRLVDFSNIYVNLDNTPLEDLKLNTYPIEVLELFMDFICNVPYIKECISINKPRACDLPRDEQGRIIVRIGLVHHLENMDYFRLTAIHYLKTGKLTDYRVNSNPNSDYGRWFKEEIRRCWEGMVRPEDGEWITGDMYFFLNYCPIMQSKTKVGSKKALRVWDFPEVWEGHYYKFHYIEQARNSGLHGAELASRGKGKAHPYSLKVYTPDGLKTWGEILIGSQLIGDDGEITTVIDIPFDDVCDVYKITLKDGREVYASENHLWKVIKRHSKLNLVRICSTKLILDNLFYNRRVNYRNPNGREYIYGIIGNSGVNCWKEKEVSISPYTMGLIIGDGCFRNKDLANNVYFTSSYEDMITYKSIVPYNIKYLKTDKEFFINIPNVKYKLQEYGLHMLKSEDKFIPDDYKFNSRRVRLDILKGLMDSDGTVTNGIPVLSTASKRLADDVAFIARSLGYNCVIRTKRNRGYRKNNQFIKCLDAYEVRIFTNDKIFNLKRKYEKLTDFSSKYSRSNKESTTIVDILFSHRERCKCVTVDNESNCYLVGDFVTTHNSYSLAALLAKRFILGENKETTKEVKCLVTAYLKEYLNRDGVLNKFQSYIDFCSDNTQFPNKKLKNSLNDMNWTMGYFDLDTQTRKGTLNEVLGVSSKDDDSKLRGKRAALIGIEEFGSFPNLLGLYGTLRPGMEEGDYAFGLIWLLGTAGDKSSDFHAAETLMYQPIGYHLYPVLNVYDKIGLGRKHFVYFFPGFINRKGCYDHDGNSDVTKAILEILVERYIIKHNATDVNAISKAISEIPITPQEAIIKAEGCLFPIALLTERLNLIDGNPSEYDDVYVGSLVQNSNGEVEYLPTNETPIHIFPTKDNKLSGAIEIFQMPLKNRDGKVQPNRYIIGYDPVAADLADTMSLASVFVLDLFTDLLVAEYTGRLIYEDLNHEIVRLMCLFYNAKCMYENNIKGCYAYFAKMNCLHLLADTPEYLRDKLLVKTVGWGNTSKGIRASKPINGFGDLLIKDWLLKPVPKVVKDEDGNDKEIAVPNLYLIRNRALLEELIQYNPYINVDRIRALSSLMLYREEKIIIYLGKMKLDEDDYDASYLGNDDFFTRNYNKKQSFLKY